MRNALLCLIVASGCVKAPTSSSARDPALDDIADWEDRRSLAQGQLVALTTPGHSSEVRKRALLALGRIQDPTTTPALLGALTDEDPGVREEAAFAAGVLAQSWVPLETAVLEALTQGLLAIEQRETHTGVRIRLLEALGKTGQRQALGRLVERLDGPFASTAALALGVRARLGVAAPEDAWAKLAPLLASNSPDGTRYAAAYALAQSKGSAVAHSALVGAAGDRNAEVRALVARGLGAANEAGDLKVLEGLLADAEAHVAIEATRALVKRASNCAPTVACPEVQVLELLGTRVDKLLARDLAQGALVLLAFAQAPLPPVAAPVVKSLRARLASKGTQNQMVREDIARLDCRLAAASDRLLGHLEASLFCGDGAVPREVRLAWGLNELATRPAANPDQRANEVSGYLSEGDARVKLAALAVLGETPSATSVAAVRSQLSSGDWVVAATAAQAAASLRDRESLAPILGLLDRVTDDSDVALAVLDAVGKLGVPEAAPHLERWLQSPKAATRMAAAAALSVLRKTAVPVPPIEETRPIRLTRALTQTGLEVKTNKGSFEIELFTDEAPLTSLNMVTLARRGYFRGLTFHRVVPNFVVQGGDPRGDGEGGPGYSIRCEINHVPYARGVVGMALSGKDTGGSQFFVALSAQPHLDGRYTTFGRVTKGLEVVDSLIETDRIIDVRELSPTHD